MNTHLATEDLSAYLDGEAADSEGVSAHLATCPDCARRHQELLRLSTQVRSLPAPEVRPGFVTRTMAAVAETRGEKPHWWIRFVLRPGLVCAAILVAVGVGMLSRSTPRPVPIPYAVTGTALMDEGVPGDRALAHADIEAMVALDDAMGGEDAAEVSADDLLAGLHDADWLPVLASQWDADADLDALIGSLDASERETLKELVREYAKEDQVI